jgi:hypothetical protein
MISICVKHKNCRSCIYPLILLVLCCRPSDHPATKTRFFGAQRIFEALKPRFFGLDDLKPGLCGGFCDLPTKKTKKTRHTTVISPPTNHTTAVLLFGRQTASSLIGGAYLLRGGVHPKFCKRRSCRLGAKRPSRCPLEAPASSRSSRWQFPRPLGERRHCVKTVQTSRAPTQQASTHRLTHNSAASCRRLTCDPSASFHQR